jgi:hypothetical protein
MFSVKFDVRPKQQLSTPSVLCEVRLEAEVSSMYYNIVQPDDSNPIIKIKFGVI